MTGWALFAVLCLFAFGGMAVGGFLVWWWATDPIADHPEASE